MRFVLVSALLLVSACASPESTLEVRLVTGLVAGPEFRTVETELLAPSSGSVSSRVAMVATASVHETMSFAGGRPVARFTVSDGTHRLRVRLLRPNGGFLVDRTVTVTVAGDSAVQVHITRDCVGVACPSLGGASELSTCLMGRCVDERCNEQHHEFCPTLAFCRSEADCRPSAACATSACSDGVCVQASVDAACSDTEWCNPDIGAGCQPLDVSANNVGFPCGTICTEPTGPCRFGYWRCADGETPTCVSLQNRPAGFVCGPSLVCDGAGECGVATPLPPRVVVGGTALDTTEAGGTSLIDVSLSEPPTNDVTVTFESSDPTEAMATPAMLVFNASNYDVVQQVTVAGLDDAVMDGDVSYVFNVLPTSSADPRFDNLDTPAVPGVNRDDDVASVLPDTTEGLVTTESSVSTTFDIVLTSEPTDEVHVSCMSNDSTEGAAMPAALVFTSATWNVPQTITVTGIDDSDPDGDIIYDVVCNSAASVDPAYAGLPSPIVRLTNVDDDVPSIVASRTTGVVTTEAGLGADTFTLQLNGAPTSDVTVSLSSDDVSEGTVAPATLTFTAFDWAMPRTITVSGVDDLVIDGDAMYTVTARVSATSDPVFSATADRTVECLNLDDEVPGVTVAPASILFTDELGATASFTVVLAAPPIADVAIAVASGNPVEGSVVPSSLTFTVADWNVPQTVVVEGIDDGYIDGDVGYSVDMAATSADPAYDLFPVSSVGVVNRTRFLQEAYVKAAHPGVNDVLGASLDLSADGNTLVVGAPGEAGASRVINGDETDNSALYAGAAYVFVRTGSTWTQQAYIKPSNLDADDRFGGAVRVSSDGNVMAVAAHYESSNATGINGNQNDNSLLRAGAVYIFRRTGVTWAQEAYIKPSLTYFGQQFGEASIDLSGDGSTLVVGATRDASDSVGINGSDMQGTTFGSGAAYVFTRTAGVWSQQAYIKAALPGNSDFFGSHVALANDGNTLVVAAAQEASMWQGVAAMANDDSAFAAGAIYVFTRSGVTWSQDVYIKASNAEALDAFGSQVAISGDGSTIAASAAGEASSSRVVNGNQASNAAGQSGAIYVFVRSGMTWSQQAYVKASNADPGDSLTFLTLSQNGGLLVAGAPNEQSRATGVNGNGNVNVTDGVGAVYVYTRDITMWRQPIFLKSSNPDQYDSFARVALSDDGHTLAVGATGEASSAPGVNGDQNDDSLADSGAVYMFNVY